VCVCVCAKVSVYLCEYASAASLLRWMDGYLSWSRYAQVVTDRLGDPQSSHKMGFFFERMERRRLEKCGHLGLLILEW
jgi:hypothetical protein